MKIIQRPSSYHEDRVGNVPVSFLVLHYTETQGMQAAEDYFLGRKPHPSGGRVSCHYMVDEDGAVYQYVDEEKRAWHAGESFWDGIKDLNSHSIGIEIVNPGHKYGYREFPDVQMQSVIKLCQNILKRHNIRADRVLAHSDIAPYRPDLPLKAKIDPGELFDWVSLAQEGVGVWPRPLKEDFIQAASFMVDEEQLKRAFVFCGYNPDAPLSYLVAAYQRHFYQEAFEEGGEPESLNQAAAARLACLVRMKNELKV